MSTFVIHATQLEVFVPRLALRKRYGGSIHFQINRIKSVVAKRKVQIVSKFLEKVPRVQILLLCILSALTLYF